MIKATKENWDELKPLSERPLTVLLDLHFTDRQMQFIQLGFVPPAMEFKWFMYFENNILHLHRSWTGYKVAEVFFEETTSGWCASRMQLALDPEFFSLELEEATQTIVAEIQFCASGASQDYYEDPMIAALSQAGEPYYFGSPEVMSTLITPYFNTVLLHQLRFHFHNVPDVSLQDVYDENAKLTAALVGTNKAYHGLEAWRTESGLGKAVVTYLGLDTAWYADENLTCLMTEGLAAIQNQVSAIITDAVNAGTTDAKSIAAYITLLRNYTSTVLMGTNTLFYPDLTLNDFSWKNMPLLMSVPASEGMTTEEEPTPGPSTHPCKDEHNHVVRLANPSTPSKQSAWHDASQMATCIPRGKVPDRVNGIAFDAWDAVPNTALGWNLVAGINAEIAEPPLSSNNGKKLAAGAVVVEPDGRIWVIHPSNQFGGYAATFPKGRIDHRLSLQAVAIKETYEESGLAIRIVGLLGDFERTTTLTRYYLAQRIGGSPADMGWESQAVSLTPVEHLDSVLNGKADKPVLAALRHVLGG